MFWKYLSKALKLLGALAFFGFFSTQLYLIHKWRVRRPRAPYPAQGRTVTLPWCLGAHGTPKERALLNSCSSRSDVSLLAVFLGVAVSYFKFGKFPTDSKGLR